MIRVDIKPELLRWARERAGYTPDTIAERFPNLSAWEQGTEFPAQSRQGNEKFSRYKPENDHSSNWISTMVAGHYTFRNVVAYHGNFYVRLVRS